MNFKDKYRYITCLNVLVAVLTLMVLTGCSQNRTLSPKTATSKPYIIKGIKYYPQEHYEYSEEGIASYYGIRDGFHGKKTSTGEIFNAHALTAAHKTLPLPSVVRVTNLENGRALHLKVNDRGPFIDGRIIDVSSKAAQLLGFYHKGITKVRVECMVEPSLALLQQPEKGVPTMLATAERPKRVDFDFGELPVQKLLAQSEQGGKLAGDAIPLPKRRPGWNAVKELFTPASQGKGNASIEKNTGIFVQVGAFSKYKNAEHLSHKLKRLTGGVPVRLNTIAMNNTPMFIVRLGPVDSSEKAEHLINQMTKVGHYDAQIIYN